MSISDDCYRCRDCRFGPKDNRVGWTDNDYGKMYYITPRAMQWRGGGQFPVSIECVPCDKHLAELEL